MSVWIVRGGRYGEYEDEALERGMITIGFNLVYDLTGAPTKEDLSRWLQEANPNATPKQISSWTGQTLAFRDGIQVGDIIVMPRKGQSTIAVGIVTGEYQFYQESTRFIHVRAVDWINQEVAKASLDQDLQNSISGISTVFQSRKVDAENRIRALAGAELIDDSNVANDMQEEVIESEPPLDVAEYAETQVREYIAENFHEHKFTQLVGAVLRAEGYTVEVAPPGPDGGIDIVAGSGPMGFDPPRICVQVKAGLQITRVNVLRELEGILKNFGADYGLLVSWGGFTRDTKSEARKSTYFNVRLWDSEAFLKALFANYDRLPAVLRAELPMKQIWILDEPTE